MSLLVEAGRPASSSGAMYCGVPAISAPASAAAVAMPKSVMRTSAVAVEHHVGRLQVAVQHAAFVAAATPAHS